jgi:hypothetical protein
MELHWGIDKLKQDWQELWTGLVYSSAFHCLEQLTMRWRLQLPCRARDSPASIDDITDQQQREQITKNQHSELWGTLIRNGLLYKTAVH